MSADAPARSEAEAKAWVAAQLTADAFNRMETFVGLLGEWGGKTNLLGGREFGRVWSRHVRNSLQLRDLAAGSLMDLGSGGGFPGMVLALADPDRRVTLVESNRKKAGFLAHVAGVTGANVTVRPVRIEAMPVAPSPVVSARALAPLATMLPLAARFFGDDTVGLFPKGKEAANEVEAARRVASFSAELCPSVSDGEAAIVIVRHLSVA